MNLPTPVATAVSMIQAPPLGTGDLVFPNHGGGVQPWRSKAQLEDWGTALALR